MGPLLFLGNRYTIERRDKTGRMGLILFQGNRYIIESTDKTGRMGPLIFLGHCGDTVEIMLAGNSLNITQVFEVRPGITLLDGLTFSSVFLLIELGKTCI